MFVNTNVAALNAWRNLENTQGSMTNVLQQLSSGYRINTAANDPAGLAISQQMQSQIDGMNQAYQNSQAGITLLQTADGAMGQVQNILQSMYSLASEAATGTNNSTDLQALQQEMNQYAQEITQIANTTQFNNLNLLGGVFQNQSIQIGANTGQSLSIGINAVDAYSLGVSGEAVSAPTAGNLGLVNPTSAPNVNGLATTAAGQYDYVTFSTTPWTPTISGTSGVFSTISGTYNSSQAESVQFAGIGQGLASGATTTVTITYNGTSYTSTATVGASNVLSVTDQQGNTLALTMGNIGTADTGTVTIAPQSTNFYAENSTNGSVATPATNALVSTQSSLAGAIVNGQQVSLSNTSNPGEALSFVAAGNVPTTQLSWTVAANAVTAFTVTNSYAANYTSTGTTSLTANAVGDTYQFAVANGGAAGSGTPSNFTNATVAAGLNISSQTTAAAALTTLQTAINSVSSSRATVGAYQNRLQFASSQLQTTSQNLTTAQAGIMDADVALQMSNLTRYQVLQQAGVAMLAQANAMPQALLKLFP